jgi:hypothetical protein
MTSTEDTPPWQPDPEPESKTAFVFLSVDVVGHSTLVKGAKSNMRMREVHQILTHVQRFAQEKIPRYRSTFQWDWAGDGGIFAFPASNLDYPTTERVLDCAVSIWQNIELMNDPYILERNDGQPLHLHLTLGRGDAYYVEDPGLRRSHALNVVMKTKGPSRQTSILISEDVMEDLPQARRLEFTRLHLASQDEPVYAYAPAIEAALRNLAQSHEGDGELMEAAHCSYREAMLNIAIGTPDGAIDALVECRRRMDAVHPTVRHRYFWHTLRGFYEAWAGLLRDGPRDLFLQRCEDRRSLLLQDEAIAFYRSSPASARIGNLLTQVEFIFEQLDILAGKIVNEPTGLATLEICLLLQRCGYSRRYDNHVIRERLERIKAEIAENHHRSIHEDCSLCSAAAASCLLLAGDDLHANELLDWLRLLRPVRYCHLGQDYTDAPSTHHALDYTGVVMRTFVDCATDLPRRAEDLRSVKEVLLHDDWSMPRGRLPPSWMQYRHTNEFETCSFILPSFVHYALAAGALSTVEKGRCSAVLRTLADALMADAASSGQQDAPGRLYGARVNIGSLALGLVAGIRLSINGESIARHDLNAFAKRAGRHGLNSAQRRQTLSSYVNNTRSILAGWLLQWEMILAILATPEAALPAYARELLTVWYADAEAATTPVS